MSASKDGAMPLTYITRLFRSSIAVVISGQLLEAYNTNNRSLVRIIPLKNDHIKIRQKEDTSDINNTWDVKDEI